MEQDVFQVNHHHVVFTIDKGLRDVFLLHREKLLKEFMDEAVRIVKEHFEKKHKVTPGIIAGLHTFGARINFNPHIHILVTMGGTKSLCKKLVSEWQKAARRWIVKAKRNLQRRTWSKQIKE